jgi:hypothetical protein
MLDKYQYTYNCTFIINTADDNRDNTQITDVDIYTSYPLYRTRVEGPSYRKEIMCHLTRSSKKGDPVMLGIANTLESTLRLQTSRGGRYGTSEMPENFKVAIVFPNTVTESTGGPMIINIEKKNPYYYLMNNRVTKKNCLLNVARTIYRSCFEEDSLKLMEYMFNMIVLPENIKYVLENRTPYFFINDPLNKKGQRERVEVRLNTEMIGPTTAALEISDGIWAPIEVKDLDVFINFHYHGHQRSTKWMLSPKGLWTTLIGEKPTESQEHLMYEFLTQNRTSDLIEERAKQLMQDLVDKYPEKIKIVKYQNNQKKWITAMLVRGKMADWIIIDSAYKTQIQKVKTFLFVHKDTLLTEPERRHGITEVNNFDAGLLRGPICIDNIHTNTSLGDQYAARALALLNDNVTIQLVNTIQRYVPTAVLNGEMESRFDFENLTGSDIRDRLGNQM